MNVTIESLDDIEFRVQPLPRAAARIIPTGGRGIARDRVRLWSEYGRRYRRTMSAMARAVEEARSPGGSHPDDDGVNIVDDGVRALADLAAVHLYVAEEWAWLDPAQLEGTLGAHLPLARCVASGLRRLPAYQGPAKVRIDVADSVVRWYRDHPIVVDQGFWSAMTSAAAVSAGGPGYLVWSLTGRRTDAVDPYTPERVVFLPGTRFKVLQVLGGLRPVVLMREMFPQEPAVHRPGRAGSRHSEWLDASTVAELKGVSAEPSGSVPAESRGPCGRPPGLVMA
ncbi:hypothetical protein M2283_006000 [Streptomyces pseudovenezuelae]|uniref:ADP ribosyltransferase domain-containing protein n=1 Tax=Streptomyces pseudovenezuelae TaxID=67350 RepID=A0ABT6LSM2_9ACTN|nr:hypothetical protein [Streptomyces pseudovenezuelae]